MANEFIHKDVGAGLTEAEYDAVGAHVFNSQATGDVMYASSATQLSRLAKGTQGNALIMGATVPEWFTGLILSNDGTKTTILGLAGDYTRIGDAATTSHALAAEDDLMVTGKHEVKGVSFFDSQMTVSVASAAALKIIGDTNYPLDVERTYPSSAVIGVAVFRGNITSAQMDIGTGAIIIFELEDEDNVQNLMGYQGFKWNGADNSGKYIVYNRQAGVTQETISFYNDTTRTTIQVQPGNYFRFGDAVGTQHSLASEDDVLVTGKLEVAGITYIDGALNIADNLFIAESANADADVGAYGQFWVKNDAPNVAMFTDDTGVDHVLLTGATGIKHEFHVPFEDPTAQVGNWDVVEINASQDTHFVVQIPENFVSLVNARIVMIPDTTETIQWDINVSVAAAGEAQDNDTRSAVNQQLAVTASQLTEVNISGQLSGLAGGDYVAIDFVSDTTKLRILGFEFDYL